MAWLEALGVTGPTTLLLPSEPSRMNLACKLLPDSGIPQASRFSLLYISLSCVAWIGFSCMTWCFTLQSASSRLCLVCSLLSLSWSLLLVTFTCLCCLYSPATFVVMILLVHAMIWYHKCFMPAFIIIHIIIYSRLYTCVRIGLQTPPCMMMNGAFFFLWCNKTKLCMTTTQQASPRTEAWRTSSVAVRPSWNMVEFPCWPPWVTSHQPLGCCVCSFFLSRFFWHFLLCNTYKKKDI